MRSKEESGEAVTLHWPSFLSMRLVAAVTTESWQSRDERSSAAWEARCNGEVALGSGTGAGQRRRPALSVDNLASSLGLSSP